MSTTEERERVAMNHLLSAARIYCEEHPGTPLADALALESLQRIENRLLKSAETPRPEGVVEQEPVAWRYRYRATGERQPWRYEERAEWCNPSPEYEREPLYAHPFLQTEAAILTPDNPKEGT